MSNKKKKLHNKNNQEFNSSINTTKHREIRIEKLKK